MDEKIPFNRPYFAGNEIEFLKQVQANQNLAGDGAFTFQCQNWLQQKTHVPKVLLVHSCTAALEMSALILNIKPGDEIIMPSYTFPSTANAFVLRGAIPVFVDIRSDTLNLNENLIEEAITKRTKAIVVVHYAGVACEMNTILKIANKHNLKIIEDAAQGIMATYEKRALGSFGDLGAYSFHETKNIISGEGGALLINNLELFSRGEMMRCNGSDRGQFLRGEIERYTWQEVGSSFLPSELMAAFLWAQLQRAQFITEQRMMIWQYYHQLLKPLEQEGLLRRPTIPKQCVHNAHIYYIILNPTINRQLLLKKLKQHGICATSHYIPLHNSPAGLRYGRVQGELDTTIFCATQIVRLPLWVGLKPEIQEKICTALAACVMECATA